MVSKITTFGLSGTRSFRVTVETDIAKGIPYFEIVGLGSETVRESRKRIKSAVANRGFQLPLGHVTQNLAPADVRKTVTGFDLPLAAGLLKARSDSPGAYEHIGVIGELSLDGSVVPVKGVLPAVACGRSEGITDFIVPEGNYEEACMCPGVNVYPVGDLKDAIDAMELKGGEFREACASKREAFGKDGGLSSRADGFGGNEDLTHYDFADVYGQKGAKRALEIAAAGKHNVLMTGSPGCGKTLLAKCFAGILPDLSYEEFFEVMQVYSSCGLPGFAENRMARPFRTIHHGITKSALLGGGRPVEIGEVSLAHCGVIFFDELSETPKSVVETLRQPLEDGKITITRSSVTVTYPSNIMVVAAMNPCPCGYFGHPTRECSCSEAAKKRYRDKTSGPLLDRIDIHIEMQNIDYEKLSGKEKEEPSSEIRKRVNAAREIQRKRFEGTNISCNANMTPRATRQFCILSKEADALLKKSFDSLGLSARAYDKILRISRTIADLEGSENIEIQHVAEAIPYRSLDRKYWR